MSPIVKSANKVDHETLLIIRKIPRRFLLRPRDGARDLARRPRDPGPAHIVRKRRNRTFSAHEQEIGSIEKRTSPKRNTSLHVILVLWFSAPNKK